MATAPRLPSDPQPHPPTNTGPLTGVANFVWDGTTWVASDGSGGGGAGELGYQPALLGAASGYAGDAVTRGWLVQGQVHSAPPTYYVGNDYPISLDTAGNLRVIAQLAGAIVTPSYSFTRPADTNPYQAGDLVANDIVAGSVVPLSWTAARVAAGSCYVRRVRLFKSSPVTTDAIFRVHLYSAAPASITNGDNEPFLTSGANYCGAVDIQSYETFTDGAWADGVPITGAEINVVLPAGQLVYGLLEALSTYAPGSAEQFTVMLEVQQN